MIFCKTQQICTAGRRQERKHHVAGVDTGTIYENLAPASRRGQKAQGKDTLRQ